MTIIEAIALLELNLKDPVSVDLIRLVKAQKLGIEALKSLRRHRHESRFIDHPLLPGETKENL